MNARNRIKHQCGGIHLWTLMNCTVQCMEKCLEYMQIVDRRTKGKSTEYLEVYRCYD